MILVTVGGQLPFDRLVRAVDGWAEASGRSDVFCQLGAGVYRPRRAEWVDFLSPRAFRERFEHADAIVSHAGMGTVIAALEAGKPIVVMPRRASLGEQRNDHQLATAERLRERPGVVVAMDEEELVRRLAELDELIARGVRPGGEVRASARLLDALREFVAGSPARRRRGGHA